MAWKVGIYLIIHTKWGQIFTKFRIVAKTAKWELVVCPTTSVDIKRNLHVAIHCVLAKKNLPSAILEINNETYFKTNDAWKNFLANNGVPCNQTFVYYQIF